MFGDRRIYKCDFCSYHSIFAAGVNTLRPRRNEQHFADNIFRRIFFNENACISIKISLKFVPQGPNNNIPALVQIMAWRLPGDKPLSKPMIVSVPTHICVTSPQWVKKTMPTYRGHQVLRPGFVVGWRVSVCLSIHAILVTSLGWRGRYASHGSSWTWGYHRICDHRCTSRLSLWRQWT